MLSARELTCPVGSNGADPRGAEWKEKLDRLLRALARLHHRMGCVGDQMHGEGRLAGVPRGILRDLSRLGPRTVPQLARVRDCSRQHVQAAVNPLVAAGYVELADNPAHKKSRFVCLTEMGRGFVERMLEREARMLSGLEVDAGAEDLASAARVLEVLHRAVSGPGWERVVEAEVGSGSDGNRAAPG